MTPRVLMLDNYDSFTYNLVDSLRAAGADVTVRLNDEIDAAAARDAGFTHIVVSPGPGAPGEAGASIDVIRALAPECNVLGVCLGHQALVEAFGGRIVRAPSPVHGRASRIRHDGEGLFAGLPETVDAGRYHSLVADESSLPSSLRVTARTEDGLIMGVRHAQFACEGVQFHPESVLTPQGGRMICNFLRSTADGRL